MRVMNASKTMNAITEMDAITGAELDRIVHTNACVNAHPDQPAPGAVHVYNAFDSIEGYVVRRGPTNRIPRDHWWVETYYLPRSSGRIPLSGCENEPVHLPHNHCPRQHGASRAVESLAEVGQALSSAFWETRYQKS